MKGETYQDCTAMGRNVRDFLADWPLAQRSRDSYEETLGWMCLHFPTTTLEDLVHAGRRSGPQDVDRRVGAAQQLEALDAAAANSCHPHLPRLGRGRGTDRPQPVTQTPTSER